MAPTHLDRIGWMPLGWRNKLQKILCNHTQKLDMQRQVNTIWKGNIVDTVDPVPCECVEEKRTSS